MYFTVENTSYFESCGVLLLFTIPDEQECSTISVLTGCSDLVYQMPQVGV